MFTLIQIQKTVSRGQKFIFSEYPAGILIFCHLPRTSLNIYETVQVKDFLFPKK